MLALALAFALAAPPAQAAVSPAFTGAQVCTQCHPKQARTQSASRHAAALRPAGQTDLAALMNARPLRERSGVEFSYSPRETGVVVSITQGSSRLDALFQWAFGAGAQAITPVTFHDGAYYEHRLSWYREPGHAARTLGHPGAPSPDPAHALGIQQPAATITQCFGCHATGVRPGPDLTHMSPGVTCERCHGPGSTHAASASRADIVRLSKRSTKDSVQQCAECHRATAPLDDPASVRYQPAGLTASRCFQASGTLSCLTCHDPHADASHDAAFYSARCLSCHTAPPAPNTATKPCPRATPNTDCLPCHMKKSSPFPFLTFTEHRIR